MQCRPWSDATSDLGLCYLQAKVGLDDLSHIMKQPA